MKILKRAVSGFILTRWYGEWKVLRFFAKTLWNGKTHELAASTLIRHEGVIPRIQIPDSLGMDLAWDAVQRYWYPKTDGFGRTSLNNVYITGDNSFVHGGEAAIWKGYVCGYAIAEDLGIVPDSEVKEKSQEYVRKMELLCRVREYLRHVFAPRVCF
ncbi:MAG: hypothetical protein K2I05_03525 [Mailhella sp.]|nr:hypothetical protein [Mailhella sp.]